MQAVCRPPRLPRSTSATERRKLDLSDRRLSPELAPRPPTSGVSSNNDPSGIALGVGFGNDWWVSDDWSIGVLGRVIYAPLSYSAGGTSDKFSTITPAVMATFIYN